MNKKILKGIGAVIAGFLTVFVLSTVTDLILEAVGIFPPLTRGLFNTNLLVLALAYRTVYTVLGGFVTAKLAPNNPMKHVIILASIGTAAGILGVVATWGKDLGPEWYPITLAVLAFPSVWHGGKLYQKKHGKK